MVRKYENAKSKWLEKAYKERPELRVGCVVGGAQKADGRRLLIRIYPPKNHCGRSFWSLVTLICSDLARNREFGCFSSFNFWIE
ncbi:hypothetical protein VNO78_19852 [Psophocarpus tetragonolobus]|uniref:Uncharacterized protein n=1 Tax=Psophocarpus tetragonolobus TaxID=3891 RepID=A0AAN9S8V6_PSOTE